MGQRENRKGGMGDTGSSMLTHQSLALPLLTMSFFNPEGFSTVLLGWLSSRWKYLQVLELRQEVTRSEVSISHISSKVKGSHNVIVKSDYKDHNSTNRE